jgi:hypothetical protein
MTTLNPAQYKDIDFVVELPKGPDPAEVVRQLLTGEPVQMDLSTSDADIAALLKAGKKAEAVARVLLPLLRQGAPAADLGRATKLLTQVGAQAMTDDLARMFKLWQLGTAPAAHPAAVQTQGQQQTHTPPNR